MDTLLNMLESSPLLWSFLMIGITPLILGTMWFFLHKHITEWSTESRGFKALESKWRYIFYYSFIGGWVLSILAGFLSDFNLYLMLILGILSFVLIFSTITDVIVHKAPKEVARYGIYASMLVAGLAISDNIWNQSSLLNNIVHPSILHLFPFASTIGEAQLYTIGLWLLVPLLLLLVSRGGIGMADVRLLILAGISLSWWVGLMNMIVAFFIANLIQVLAFIPGQKFNWGRMIERPNGKQRRAIPFIPALAVSFLTMAFVTITQL